MKIDEYFRLDHEQIVDMLIKNGSLLNIANNDGEKPMDIAVKRGKP